MKPYPVINRSLMHCPCIMLYSIKGACACPRKGELEKFHDASRQRTPGVNPGGEYRQIWWYSIVFAAFFSYNLLLDPAYLRILTCDVERYWP
jgi:hypothetical protein